MLTNLSQHFRISNKVEQAIKSDAPVVALESTVITHGLPHPENLYLAKEMQDILHSHGAVPATIAVLEGKLLIGMDDEQLTQLANDVDVVKISTRDINRALTKRESGGTTVASTLFAANSAGIQTFATGGIGGVHRYPPNDVSSDLFALAKWPVIVVCAGAKAILDLPATLEYLETHAIPVIGFQCDEFPAFYSTSSGLKTSARADSPAQIVDMALTHWGLGLSSSILVVLPPPIETALPAEVVDSAINVALQEAESRKLYGQEITPFMLKRVNELTGGASLLANLDLLKNNARLAAKIACALSERTN